MRHKSILLSLFGCFILPLSLLNTSSHVVAASKIHDEDCTHRHPVKVHFVENLEEKTHLAGYGSCEYCGCPAFTESYNDSYRCECGHSWYSHYSAGA